MNDDIDSSISLNLFTPNQRSKKDGSQTRTKITGNRVKHGTVMGIRGVVNEAIANKGITTI